MAPTVTAYAGELMINADGRKIVRIASSDLSSAELSIKGYFT